VFWELMDFRFSEGGPFTALDERQGNFVAVINRTTRERFFRGEPALGETIRFDGQSFAVVGVVDDVAPTRRLAYAEIWVPISTLKSTTYRHDLIGGFIGIVLAQDRAEFPRIKQEFARRLSGAELPDPERYDTLISAANTRFEDFSQELLTTRETAVEPPVLRLGMLLGGIVLLFMALPALNLVNINLSRILERSSEIGVRKAFGGSSWNLVGQFLVENVVLTLLGGALGLGLSLVAMQVLNGSEVLPYVQIGLNVRVFLAALLLSLIFGLFSGAYPAWRMSRMHPVRALHGRD
jgi:putative ABC transport system permease protein